MSNYELVRWKRRFSSKERHLWFIIWRLKGQRAAILEMVRDASDAYTLYASGVISYEEHTLWLARRLSE